MNDKMIDDLVNIYQDDAVDGAWDRFSSLPLNEKKDLLGKLLELTCAPRRKNKAVIMPNVASVITRELKPNVDFEQWYEGWLPPVPPQKVGKEIVRDYFPVPTRVINLRSINNDGQFLTIGFVYNPYESLDELLKAKPKEVQANELKRREVNDALLAKSEAGFYTIASDDIFGV